MPESPRYAPPTLTVVIEALAAVAIAALGVTSGERTGLLLGGAAAVLLAGVAARDALVRPVLAADDDGLTVATGWSHRRIPWASVTAVHAGTEARRGIRSAVLEIDLDETLVLLSRRQLGADPVDVAEALEALRSGRPVRPSDPQS